MTIVAWDLVPSEPVIVSVKVPVDVLGRVATVSIDVAGPPPATLTGFTLNVPLLRDGRPLTLSVTLVL